MNTVVATLTPENTGSLLPKLKGTFFRNALIQDGVGKKVRTLLHGASETLKPIECRVGEDKMQYHIKHIVTRPLGGVTIDFITKEFSNMANGTPRSLLIHHHNITKEEIYSAQGAHYKISVVSESWRDSSYIQINL